MQSLVIQTGAEIAPGQPGGLDVGSLTLGDGLRTSGARLTISHAVDASSPDLALIGSGSGDQNGAQLTGIRIAAQPAGNGADGGGPGIDLTGANRFTDVVVGDPDSDGDGLLTGLNFGDGGALELLGSSSLNKMHIRVRPTNDPPSAPTESPTDERIPIYWSAELTAGPHTVRSSVIEGVDGTVEGGATLALESTSLRGATPGDGAGTDHGWGGNYFVLGRDASITFEGTNTVSDLAFTADGGGGFGGGVSGRGVYIIQGAALSLEGNNSFDNVDIQSSGSVTVAENSIARLENGATLEISGGSMKLETGASVQLDEGSTATVSDATLQNGWGGGGWGGGWLTGDFDAVVSNLDSMGWAFDSVTDNTSASFTVTRAGQAVPEPGTWVMMLAGFGLAGLRLRRRKVHRNE